MNEFINVWVIYLFCETNFTCKDLFKRKLTPKKIKATDKLKIRMLILLD